MSCLTIRDLLYTYDDFHLKLTYSINEGELVTLLGPSGCGKTTTLRLVGGYLAPDAGTIRLGARDITPLPPGKRNMGMVFQNYALFQHMDVAENLAFGLKARKRPRQEVFARVEELLKLTGLQGYGRRKTQTLSGGEKQRVALARALAPGPELLLLDEPLSALDAALRTALRGQIRRIQRETGITTLYVTHDQEEALAISDTIILMRDGRVVQSGSPRDLYRNPATLFAARFLGGGNFLRGSVESSTGRYLKVTTVLGPMLCRRPGTGNTPGDGIPREGTLFFRSASARPGMSLSAQSADTGKRSEQRTKAAAPEPSLHDTNADNRFSGIIDAIEYLGHHQVTLRCRGTVLKIQLQDHGGVVPVRQEKLDFHVDPEDCVFIPEVDTVT